MIKSTYFIVVPPAGTPRIRSSVPNTSELGGRTYAFKLVIERESSHGSVIDGEIKLSVPAMRPPVAISDSVALEEPLPAT